MTLKYTHVTYAIIAAFALVTTIGTTSVFATHVSGVEDYEWHIWSRNSGDGHLSYLNCDAMNDYCELKIKTISGIQAVAQSAINTEVDEVETHFDSLGKKMSIDRVTVADSVITEANLDVGVTGSAIYDLHCTNFFIVCLGYDSHFEKMTVQLNDNSAEIKFLQYEDEMATPKVHDVRKTLGHELFHAMGVDHNPGSDSIVYYQYVFGSTNGYTATTQDINDLGARYP